MLPDFGPRAGIPRVGKRHPERQRDLQPGAVPRQHDGPRLGRGTNQVKRTQFDTRICSQRHAARPDVSRLVQNLARPGGNTGVSNQLGSASSQTRSHSWL